MVNEELSVPMPAWRPGSWATALKPQLPPSALRVRLAAATVLLALAATGANCATAAPLSLEPQTMPAIASVDERYLSYNVEMAEVVGGKFWKPYPKEGQPAQHGPTVKDTAPSASRQATIQIGQDPSMFEARPPVNLYDARLLVDYTHSIGGEIAAAELGTLQRAHVRRRGRGAARIRCRGLCARLRSVPPVRAHGSSPYAQRRPWIGGRGHQVDAGATARDGRPAVGVSPADLRCVFVSFVCGRRQS